MTVLVTGAAGFIGGHLTRRLLQDGCKVIGVDNLNGYYDVRLKEYRLHKIAEVGGAFEFVRGDIRDADFIGAVIEQYRPTVAVNLAGQAGVRYSMANPAETFQNNVTGFFNVLEACRVGAVEHLIFASSSAATGGHKSAAAESFYGVTKASNELLAESYSKAYGLTITGLRFFTVYGEAGRPDMAYFKFAERMTAGKSIQLYNAGKSFRSFTYIDDAVECVTRVVSRESHGYNVFDIGGAGTLSVGTMAKSLQRALVSAKVLPRGTIVKAELCPAQKGDVLLTIADMRKFRQKYGYAPKTPLSAGLERFATWFKKWRGRRQECAELT